MKLSDKTRISIEIGLILIIIIQAIAIFKLYGYLKIKTTVFLGQMVQEELCYEPLKILSGMFDKKEYESAIKYGEYLDSKGLHDTAIYHVIGKCSYIKGNNEKAIEYIKYAIDNDSYCNQFLPKTIAAKARYYEKAIINHQLSEIYGEIGNIIEKDKHYNTALLFLKSDMKEKYTLKIAKKIFDHYSIKRLIEKSGSND